MNAPTLEQTAELFSEDPEINRLCNRRAEIIEYTAYNQVSLNQWKVLSEELGEIEKKLQDLGY